MCVQDYQRIHVPHCISLSSNVSLKVAVSYIRYNFAVDVRCSSPRNKQTCAHGPTLLETYNSRAVLCTYSHNLDKKIAAEAASKYRQCIKTLNNFTTRVVNTHWHPVHQQQIAATRSSSTHTCAHACSQRAVSRLVGAGAGTDLTSGREILRLCPAYSRAELSAADADSDLSNHSGRQDTRETTVRY